MTTLLIDADGVAFQAAAAVQSVIRWDDDIYTTTGDLKEAKLIFEGYLYRYREFTEPDAKIILVYSCPTRRYFRHDILPSYKANRKGEAPMVLKDLREWSMETWDSRTKPALEADDVIGILATHPKLIKGEKIIVSGDKDLQQIPGLHLNARTPSDGVFRVNPLWADRFLWTQVLAGDSTDNYSGCPGIGPKKAEAFLDHPNRLEAILKAFEKAYRGTPIIPELELATQVNVARILTADTYDFKARRPILWHYPTPSQNAAPATAPSPPKPSTRSRSSASSSRAPTGK